VTHRGRLRRGRPGGLEIRKHHPASPRLRLRKPDLGVDTKRPSSDPCDRVSVLPVTACSNYAPADSLDSARPDSEPSPAAIAHGNRWQQSTDRFITDEMWKASLTLAGPSELPATFAVDASQRSDTTALVGIRKEEDRYRTCYLKAWNPGGRDIDLDETVVAENHSPSRIRAD
jgi:hypothetical protein